MVSEEVKPAAALSLGRMVVGKPEILLPPLIESISQAVKHHMQLTNTSGSLTSSSSIGASSGSKNNTSQHQLYYLIQALREVSFLLSLS